MKTRRQNTLFFTYCGYHLESILKISFRSSVCLLPHAICWFLRRCDRRVWISLPTRRRRKQLRFTRSKHVFGTAQPARGNSLYNRRISGLVSGWLQSALFSFPVVSYPDIWPVQINEPVSSCGLLTSAQTSFSGELSPVVNLNKYIKKNGIGKVMEAVLQYL